MHQRATPQPLCAILGQFWDRATNNSKNWHLLVQVEVVDFLVDDYWHKLMIFKEIRT